MNNQESQTKSRLDAVSPTYCVAKWKQVTMLLQTGTTHSCHHPPPHRIPLDELQANVSALHNTAHKKLQRKMMLDGQRPPECNFCWQVEDRGTEASDRIIKSGNDWAIEHLERLSVRPWSEDVSPSYLEVSFSNVCNMACAYCSPTNSTTYTKDIEDNGPYPVSEHSMSSLSRIYSPDTNPYLKAFWEWFPTIYADVNVCRITGGEPLIQEDTYRLLEHILANPNPDLTVAINTNLNVTSLELDRLIEILKKLKGRVRQTQIFASIDSFGPQAAYIRSGLDVPRFMANLWKLTELRNLALFVTSSFNVTSIPSFSALMSEVARMKKKSNTVMDISFLAYPNFMSVRVLDQAYASEKITALIKQAEKMVFFSWEAKKLRWLHDWVMVPVDEDKLTRMRVDFYRFFTEWDRRRGTNFVTIFPELEPFWTVCQTLEQSSQ